MRGLALSGGGAHGAFEVGVLDVLMREQGRDYEALAGVSVGALNAAWLAQFRIGDGMLGVEELKRIWFGLRTKDVVRDWSVGKVAALWKPSLLDSSPLRALVQARLDPQLVQRSGRKLRVVAVSWETREVFAAGEHEPKLRDWVLASSSFPCFMSPVEINGQLWTDGGLRDVTPIAELIRLGCTEIDVVVTSPLNVRDKWRARGRAFPAFVLRAVEIMFGEIVLNDLQAVGLKNELAQLGDKYRDVKVRIYAPAAPFETDSLAFEQPQIRAEFEVGRTTALQPPQQIGR